MRDIALRLTSGTTGARKKARQGAASNGSACKGGRLHLGAWTTQASPRNSRQSGVVAVLQIVTRYVDSAPNRAFFRAPPQGDRANPAPPRQAEARARRAKPGANAPARQSEANAAPGRTTGGGGRGGSTKPYPLTHPRSDPPAPAAAQANQRRRAVRRSPPSRFFPRPGDLRFQHRCNLRNPREAVLVGRLLERILWGNLTSSHELFEDRVDALHPV